MHDIKKIDLVVISTVRPNILKITLNSFKHKLLNAFDVRVIVNVDPIGENRYSQDDIVQICKEYFDDVVSRTPETPSFSAAVQWCWSQVTSDFFFHLEDDWCLKSTIEMSEVIRLLEDDDAVSVRLNVTRNSKFQSDENGIVYSNGLSLNPSMMKTAYIKELLWKFDALKDPEKQFSDNSLTPSFPHPKFLIYGRPMDKSVVIDTGKKWRRNVGLLKWDTLKEESIVWRKKEKTNRSLFLQIKYYAFLFYWSRLYCKNLTITCSGLR